MEYIAALSVGRSTVMSAPILKQQEPVLKGPSASFITQKAEARERKGNDWENRRILEAVTLVLGISMFLSLEQQYMKNTLHKTMMTISWKENLLITSTLTFVMKKLVKVMIIQASKHFVTVIRWMNNWMISMS
jgi:hypothetical protein